MLLHINAQLETWWNLFVERNGYCLICSPVGFHRGINWWLTFIDLYWRPRISRGADSWCSLQQRAIKANNQIAFVTETRANYSRYESERENNQIKQQLCFPLTPVLWAVCADGVCLRPVCCSAGSPPRKPQTPGLLSSRALEQSHDIQLFHVSNNIWEKGAET